MGSFVKDPELFNKLANEVQSNFGKLQPMGKFLNDNARIIVEVIDDKTLRITYRAMIFAASQQMFPILNEVESKNAKKATQDVIDRLTVHLKEKQDVKVSIVIREELCNQSTEMVRTNYYRPSFQAYYRWSVIADVSHKKPEKD